MTDHKTTRREFMATTGGLALGAAISPSLLGGLHNQGSKKLKILILGGTGFIGPHIVNRAVDNGHEISLFNRGKTAPEMFPKLEHFEGDRYSDLSALEKAVADGRKWDAVIDTFTYLPKTVTDAMDVLLPAMGQYVVISSVSAFADMNTPNQDESAPVATCTDEEANAVTTHREVMQIYGAMKARVETAAEARFPGHVNVIRPGLIVGPRDTTGRYTYWPVRATEGGDQLCPGSGNDFVQIVDVKDLADFTVHCCEQKHMGIYTAVSPSGERTMRDYIDSCNRVAREKGKEPTNPVWVDSDFLESQGVAAWQDMPAWIPATADGYAGIGQLSTAKAIAAGLKTRPLDDTNRDTLAYYTDRQAELREQEGDEFADDWAVKIRGGITREREAEVLKAWAERGG